MLVLGVVLMDSSKICSILFICSTQQGPEDTTGHKMQPLPSRGVSQQAGVETGCYRPVQKQLLQQDMAAYQGT